MKNCRLGWESSGNGDTNKRSSGLRSPSAIRKLVDMIVPKSTGDMFSINGQTCPPRRSGRSYWGG